MTLDASEVRAGTTGNLYSAPVGTAMPTDVATALAVDWVEMGYLTEDGPSLEASTDTNQIRGWQSIDPLRTEITGRTITASFQLMQRNIATLQLAFGGGTVVVTGTAPNEVATYTPSVNDNVFERAFVLEVVDGLVIDRYLLYRGQPALSGAIPFKRGEAITYDVSVTYLRSASGTWKLVSNDPALVA